jgi:hypothetical protein
MERLKGGLLVLCFLAWEGNGRVSAFELEMAWGEDSQLGGPEAGRERRQVEVMAIDPGNPVNNPGAGSGGFEDLPQLLR